MSVKSVLTVAVISLATTVAYQHYQTKGASGLGRRIRSGS